MRSLCPSTNLLLDRALTMSAPLHSETFPDLPLISSYSLPSSSSSITAPSPPWYTPWRSSSPSKPKKKKRPFLPPFLRFRFPLNILFFLSLPFTLPLMLGLIIFRFARQSRSSRIRLRDDDAKDVWERLKGLESRLEGTVADALGGGGGGGSVVEEMVRRTNGTGEDEEVKDGMGKKGKVVKGGLILTEDQLQMISHLEAIPQLKKVSYRSLRFQGR